MYGRGLAPHLHFDLECPLNACLFPGLAAARRLAVLVDQKEGETIFVPSGWHHTVENIEDTLSVNHNWLNGYNLMGCWKKLRGEAEEEVRSGENVRNIASCLHRRLFRSSQKKLGGEVGGAEGDFKLLEDLLEARLKAASDGDDSLSSRDFSLVTAIASEMSSTFGRGGKLAASIADVNRRERIVY